MGLQNQGPQAAVSIGVLLWDVISDNGLASYAPPALGGDDCTRSSTVLHLTPALICTNIEIGFDV